MSQRRPRSFQFTFSRGNISMTMSSFNDVQQLLSILSPEHPFGETHQRFMEEAFNPNGQRHSYPASKEAIIDLVKTQLIDDDLLNSCAICQDMYTANQIQISMPCKHLFHEQCLFQWLESNNTCPVCRIEIETIDRDYNVKKGLIRPINGECMCSLFTAEECLEMGRKLVLRGCDVGHYIHENSFIPSTDGIHCPACQVLYGDS